MGRARAKQGRTPVVGTCRLCLSDGELQRSHIISEWLYECTYDEKHRYIYVATEQSGPALYGQQGIRERLLCSPCELQLGRYEHYAKQALTGSVLLPLPGDVDASMISGIDYKRFKLFTMSIFWRALIASKPPFNAILAADDHVETLRSLIRAEDPGAPVEYGCLLLAHSNEGLRRTVTTSRGKWYPDLGLLVYKFLMGGFEWWYFVNVDRNSGPFGDYVLQRDGTLPIVSAQFSDRSWEQLIAHVKRG